MITRLDHTSDLINAEIFLVMQQSYQVEADLLQVTNFPPLFRKQEDIKLSESTFFGYFIDQELAGVLEARIENQRLDIDSLVVSPKHFKKGVASKLLSFVLENSSYDEVFVETAVANTPAIKLYEKHGFEQYKQWTPDHGIRKVAFINCSSNAGTL